jgi:DNA-binding LytR/AlgR family response regulator
MLDCIAIDDEPLALEIIREFCTSSLEITLHKTFTDTHEAARYLNKFPVDLLFLDIQMPDINGVDFYRRYAKEKMVIFTTAFSDYAVEGFNVSAVDYLLKPIDPARFNIAVTKAIEYHRYMQSGEKKEHNFLLLRSEYSLVKIPLSEIRYIETLDDYVKIHLDGKKPVLSKINLKNLMSRLDPEAFIRVHRSYIVPFNRIISVRGKTLSLGGIELPIGVKFESEFFERFRS